MTIEPSQDAPGCEEEPYDAEDCTPLEIDDEHWEAFLPDDDQRDPLPEPGDFWIETDQSSPYPKPTA